MVCTINMNLHCESVCDFVYVICSEIGNLAVGGMRNSQSIGDIEVEVEHNDLVEVVGSDLVGVVDF